MDKPLGVKPAVPKLFIAHCSVDSAFQTGSKGPTQEVFKAEGVRREHPPSCPNQG